MRGAAGLLAAACAVAALASVVIAASHHDQPGAASRDAAAAMHDIRAARAELVEGRPIDARRYIDRARDALTRVEKDATSSDLVPIGAGESMPLRATIENVDRALTLFLEDEYDQAELALEAAEHGVVTRATPAH